MPKRMLIFSLAYYPHVGGAEIAIKEITDRISPQDIEFHMITMRFARGESAREQIGNVLVHRVGLGGRYISKVMFVPLAALMARRLYKKYQYAGFWAMMSYMVFPIVLLRAFGIRLPYVLTLQEGDPFEHVFGRGRIALFSPLLNYGFRNATVVQTISTFLGKWARGRGFTGPLEVIPNGVDVQKFAKPQARFEVRKALDIRENETVLITSSRLVHKNAVDDIIRAVSLLPPTVHLLVLGTGPDEATLNELARSLKVKERVQFLGYIPHAQLPAYLQASTIFIRPSRSEGMGNSFVEAMAAGLPVIATQEGGISDFLFDAKRNPDKPTTGWAVSKDSPPEIVAAVENILGDAEQVKKVLDTARSLALEKYDWDLIAHDMRERAFKKVA